MGVSTLVLVSIRGESWIIMSELAWFSNASMYIAVTACGRQTCHSSGTTSQRADQSYTTGQLLRPRVVAGVKLLRALVGLQADGSVYMSALRASPHDMLWQTVYFPGYSLSSSIDQVFANAFHWCSRRSGVSMEMEACGRWRKSVHLGIS